MSANFISIQSARNIRHQHIPLVLLIILYVIISFFFSFNIPLSKAPDEYVHFLYIRFLIEHKRPPINVEEQQLAGYKSDQPPLYHSLVALLTAPIDVSEPPRFKFTWEPPSRKLIDIVLPRALLIHTEDEAWPLRGRFLAWFVGRWFSILLSSLTLIVTYLISLEIFPQKYWLAWSCAGALAFIPRYVFTGSVLSDENLIGLLMALFLFVVVRLFKNNNPSLLDFGIIGGLTGLALNTKYTALLVPLEFVLFTVWLARRRQWNLKTVFSRLIVFGMTSALIASVWFSFLIWNFNQISEYGLIQGILAPIMAGGNDLQESVAVLDTLSGSGQVAGTMLNFSEGNFGDWARFLFTQFWDVPIFGVPQPYPLGLVLLIALLICLIAAAGWWRRWQQNETSQRMWLGVFIIHVATFLPIPLLRFIFFGRIHDTAQARHLLFPAASAIAILLVTGFVAIFPKRWRKMAGLAIVGLAFGLTLAHLYYYMVGFPAPLPVRTDPTVVEASDHVTAVEFTDGLFLRGYDWQLTNNQVLELNLHWRADALSQVDYRTEITLHDSRGILQLRWLNHPANGRFPTRAWDVGDSVRDTLRIPLLGLPPDSYEVTLRLLDWHEVPLLSTQGDTISLFTLNLDQPIVGQEPSLWQNGRLVDGPTYRYRATIPLTGFDGQDVSLIDAEGQTRLPLINEGKLHLFMVDSDWPSGEYQVQADGLDPDLKLYIKNFEWNFSLPEMSYMVNVDFNDEIRLLGYDLPSRRVKAGEGVPLVLYWQGLRQMINSYIIFDRLLDVNQKAWGGYDRLPKETYPTNLWVPNEIVTDGFAVPIDPTTPDGVYNIVVGLYDEADPAAQSLLLSQAGQPLEMSSVTIGPVKVGGPPPGVVLAAQEVGLAIPFSAKFGEPPVISLNGYNLAQEDDALRLTLYWESLAQTPIDWTTFVHLRNKGGQTVAQKDGPVGSGRYPTSLWETGEIVADEIVIPLTDLPDDDYRLFIGLYNFITGERLSVPNNPASEVLLVEDVLAKSSVSSSELRRLAASGELATLAEVLDQRMVYIPAGEFTMGSDTAHEDERPERQVYLDAFELDRYEVTNVQYQRFLQESGEPTPQYWLGNTYPAGQADHPVVGVSWSQAKAYCEWAGKRLPTEAEWEKACRGSNGNIFPWGNVWEPQRANVGYAQAQNWPLRLDEGWALLQSTAPSPNVPHLQPVGSYPEGQSAYGVLDLTGNASEWVADWYNWSGYWDMPSRNPIGTGPPWNHSIRGSGWFDRRGYEDLIQDLSRCSSRSSSHSYDDPRLGFRCAR